MHFKTIFLAFCLVGASLLQGQHTFSIVAVDTLTGQIGSAGATCLTSADCGGCGGAIIISEVIPGRGAVNAQATVCLPNSNASAVAQDITLGLNASDALSAVLANDQCQFGNTTDRQYGIVTLQNGVVDAISYTGKGALNHAGHRTGVDYAIQGNILLGPEILDSMEARFNRSEGQSLLYRMMEAMQGANVPGADSRCLVDGLSSKSSFIRVANPEDGDGQLMVDIKVESPEFDNDPIDILQSLVDLLSNTEDYNLDVSDIKIYPNPASHYTRLELTEVCDYDNYTITDSAFSIVKSGHVTSKHMEIALDALAPGIYFVNLQKENTIIQTRKLVIQR